MNFINPFDLLNVEAEFLSEIDNTFLKKAKRKVLAEIELSDDGTISCNGIEVTRADCIRVFDELDDPDKSEYYFSIYFDRELNNFLTKGNLEFVSKNRQESKFEKPGFIDFISPYFAEKYNKVFIEALEKERLNDLVKITANPPLVNARYRDEAYQSAYSFVKDKIVDIKNYYYDENAIFETESDVRKIVNPKIVNNLPEYFQSLRNQLADVLRDLSVSIFNKINESQVALDLLRLALELRIDGVTESRLENDFQIIEKKNVLKKIVSLTNDIDGGDVILNLFDKINDILDIGELNAQPVFLDETRNQIALGLRNLSVSIWNNLFNLEKAITIVKLAKRIDVDTETAKCLDDALDDLSQIEQKSKSSKTARALTTDKSSSRWLKKLIAVAAILILVVIWWKIDDDSDFYPPKDTNQYKRPPVNSYRSSEPIIRKYIGNQLENGDSPYDHYFGRGIYNQLHHNWIEFKNGNTYDAIICLVDSYNGRTIRNEYIRAGTSFKMTNVPNGTYYIKGFFGKDWNPTKLLKGGEVRGSFDTDFHFSDLSGVDDTVTLRDYGRQYSAIRITLYSVTGGNMRQRRISKDEFFSEG